MHESPFHLSNKSSSFFRPTPQPADAPCHTAARSGPSAPASNAQPEFRILQDGPEVDSDGDLDIPRGRQSGKDKEEAPYWTIRVQHEPSSTLADVGLQLWAGSLLLSEWLLSRRRMVAGKGVLELGGGTGLCSVVAALAGAKIVYCTDVEHIVYRAKATLDLNANELGKTVSETVRVRQMDFFNAAQELEEACETCDKCDKVTATAYAGCIEVRRWLSSTQCLLRAYVDVEDDEDSGAAKELSATSDSLFRWTAADAHAVARGVTVLLAADVIYDDKITRAFVNTLRVLLNSPAHPALIMASEIRINFSLSERSESTGAFGLFHAICLNDDDFNCEQLDVNAVPHVLDYIRSPQLVLWRITAKQRGVS
eukprot:m.9221 g.9221  ORF g.9221 m.9221 type:complete len:368 (-) comp4624_c0_seq1:135-1238(-)